MSDNMTELQLLAVII